MPKVPSLPKPIKLFDVISLPKKLQDFILSKKTKKYDKKMEQLEKAIQTQQEYDSKIPPLNFEYKYSKSGFDPYSLIAASYQEMGKTSVKVSELNSDFTVGGQVYKTDASVMDLNNDGKVDLAEYSTFTLVEDALDNGDSVEVENIDGVITNVGSDKASAYRLADNKEAVKPILQALYNHFDLGSVQKEFLENKNNLVK